jgi:hypothetical protein
VGGDLAFGLVMGLAGGLVVKPLIGGGLALWLASGLAGGLAVGLTLALLDWLQSPADHALAVTPQSVLHSDRTMAVAVGLAGGLVAGLAGVLVVKLLIGGGLALWLASGLAGGLAFGLGWGLGFGLGSTSWGQFTIVRVWLAIRGQLPLQLMAFLDDAHHRGVLRQAGAVYQFRHARLQDHLVYTSRQFRSGRLQDQLVYTSVNEVVLRSQTDRSQTER